MADFSLADSVKDALDRFGAPLVLVWFAAQWIQTSSPKPPAASPNNVARDGLILGLFAGVATTGATRWIFKNEGTVTCSHAFLAILAGLLVGAVMARLMSFQRAGRLPQPVSALVFSFGAFTVVLLAACYWGPDGWWHRIFLTAILSMFMGHRMARLFLRWI